MPPKAYFIYILECHNGTYYTGYTTDIARRFQEHLQGTAQCKYTRSFPPRRLAACWKIDGDYSTVLKIEHRIKKLSKPAKEQLISHPDSLPTQLDTLFFSSIISHSLQLNWL